MLYQGYAWEFTESDTYFHPALQEQAATLVTAPLDTEEAITAYVLELCRILTELEMVDSDQQMILTEYYQDDLMLVNFLASPNGRNDGMVDRFGVSGLLFWDEESITALVSRRDGHIIHLGIVRNPRYTGFQEPSAEPLYMPFDLEDMTCQDFWGRAGQNTCNDLAIMDWKFQRIIDQRTLYLPLDTDQRVNLFAGQIRNALITADYIQPEDNAVFYMKHPNHMLSICYAPSLSGKDGGTYVIVDALSGRIAWICDDSGAPVRGR